MSASSEKSSLYYRRAASVIKLMRFVVLIGLVIFAVFCIGCFKDTLNADNLRYLFKYLDLSTFDDTPSDAEISFETSDASLYTLLGNDLAVIGKKGVELYDFAGNKLYSYDETMVSPALAVSGKYLLVYDTLGKKLSIYDAVAKIADKSFDYKVRAACINDLGYYALINSEKTYRSGILVYDSDGNELFRRMSPDKYMTGVALNANASVVVCAALSNNDGTFSTELFAYSTSTGALLASTELADTLVLSVGFADNDSTVYVLSDHAFLSFDKDLNAVGASSYNPENARFFRAFEDCFLVAESNNLSGSSMTVRAYGYDARELFSLSSEKKVIDAAYRDRTLYLLSSDALTVYDYGTDGNATLTHLATLPLTYQYRALCVDAYERYVLVGAKTAKRGALAALLQEELDRDAGSGGLSVQTERTEQAKKSETSEETETENAQ